MLMCTAALLFALQLRVLTLADAVATAETNQPNQRQAHALTDAAKARVDEARSYLLPQLNGTATYQRTTANVVYTPGVTPSTVMTAAPSWTNTFNYYNFGLSLNQFIWDFGVTTDKFRASKALALSQEQTEYETALVTVLNARTAYFTARADKELVQVAVDNLADQDKHLLQIEGFAKAGIRSQIDLAQARSDHATAKLQLITAQNNYLTAKAQLNLAMGIIGSTDYEVEDQPFPLIEGEDRPLEPQVAEALRARPELLGFDQQIRAQELTITSNRGNYGPALAAGMNLTDRGSNATALDHGYNWNFTATATWNLFAGLLNRSQVVEAEANLSALKAQLDGLRQQVRLEVDQARLAVRANKEAIFAADEALANAKIRLKLAEQRYQNGLGSIIELSDAQVALVTAAAQKIQADYNLATARAQLFKALGRK